MLARNGKRVRFRLRLHLHEYELPAGLTVVGRAVSSNLTIDDALLSREHAAIRVSEARVTVRDLGRLVAALPVGSSGGSSCNIGAAKGSKRTSSSPTTSRRGTMTCRISYQRYALRIQCLRLRALRYG